MARTSLIDQAISKHYNKGAKDKTTETLPTKEMYMALKDRLKKVMSLDEVKVMSLDEMEAMSLDKWEELLVKVDTKNEKETNKSDNIDDLESKSGNWYVNIHENLGPIEEYSFYHRLRYIESEVFENYDLAKLYAQKIKSSTYSEDRFLVNLTPTLNNKDVGEEFIHNFAEDAMDYTLFGYNQWTEYIYKK